MNRFRPWLNALVGLSLLLQGIAFAAAPAAVAAAEAAEIIMAAEATEMPCHGQPAEDAASQCPCCDRQCPDMTMCATGQIAVTAAYAVALPRQHLPAPEFTPTVAVTRAPVSPLRPPIILQG